jgi:predicted RNA-binding Zn-ribbon protein involved in translation (DUF1610 family)
MNRAVLLACFVVIALSGCANHFDSVVRTAAAKTSTCGGELAVRKEGYGYRVVSCGETSYYRCYFARRTMGRTQCCSKVADADEASSLFSVPGADGVCMNFNQDSLER